MFGRMSRTDRLRQTALVMALNADVSETAEGVVEDAERFLAFLEGRQEVREAEVVALVPKASKG